MSRLPIELDPSLSTVLAGAFDRAGKISRGLDALGPIANRDVVVIDAEGGPVIEGLAGLGARMTHAPLESPLRLPVADASADAVIGLWSAFRGVDAAEVAEADRALRPGGRLLVVHDYGRDDVALINGDRLEYGAWSHRTGPFLSGGFRVRVLHCWWEFDDVDAAGSFLREAFGDAGARVADSLKRPRLSYNVAIYHRSRA